MDTVDINIPYLTQPINNEIEWTPFSLTFVEYPKGERMFYC